MKPLKGMLPYLLLALTGCGGDSAPRADKAWIRLAPVVGQPAAAYFTLSGGGKDDRLLAIESPAVTRAELHRSMASGGMMTMQPLKEAPLPAHGALIFAPGGNHAMLFGLSPATKAGDSIPLRFRLASGAVLKTQAAVIAAGGTAPGS